MWCNGLRNSVVTAVTQIAAVARVQSLAKNELLHAMSMAKKKKKKGKNISTFFLIMFILYLEVEGNPFNK